MIKQAEQFVQEVLTTKRFDHTIRVIETASNLAELYNIDRESVQLAALLHDCAKDFSDDKLAGKIKEYNLPVELLSYNKELWHGPVAAKMVADMFNIKNEDVLNSIYYHTTGRAGMSNIELAVFVADYIEPGRNFPAVELVRELARLDLEKAAHKALSNTIIFLMSKNQLIFPDTMMAYNDLTRKGVVN